MCGTDGNKHCTAYAAFTVTSVHANCKTFAAVQLVVFVVPRCSTASLGEWYLRFRDHCVVMQCGHQSASDAMPHHRRTEIILLVCALTLNEQAFPKYEANWKCKKQANDMTSIPEPISSP